MEEQSGKKTSLFRRKSLESMSSPEDLNEYIHIAAPGVWMILLAAMILLAGFMVWTVFGTVTLHNADGSVSIVLVLIFPITALAAG